MAGGGNPYYRDQDYGEEYPHSYPYDTGPQVNQLFLLEVDETKKKAEPSDEKEEAKETSDSKSHSHDMKSSKKKKDCKDKSHSHDKKSSKKKKDHCKDPCKDPCRDPCKDSHRDPCRNPYKDPCRDPCKYSSRNPCKDPCRDPCRRPYREPNRDPCKDPCKQKDWSSHRPTHSHSRHNIKDPCDDKVGSSHRPSHSHSRHSTHEGKDETSHRPSHSHSHDKHSIKDPYEDKDETPHLSGLGHDKQSIKEPCEDKIFELHRVTPSRERHGMFEKKDQWEEAVWLSSHSPEKPGSIMKGPTEDIGWTVKRPSHISERNSSIIRIKEPVQEEIWTSQRPTHSTAQNIIAPSKYSSIVDPDNARKLSSVTPIRYSLIPDPEQDRKSSRVPTVKYSLVPDPDQDRRSPGVARSKYSLAVDAEKKSSQARSGNVSIAGLSAEEGSSFVLLDNDLSPLQDGTMSIAGMAEPETLGFANCESDERPMQQCPTTGTGWRAIVGRIARFWACIPKYKTRILYRNDLEGFFETAYNWSGMDVHGHEIYLTSGNIISVFNFKGELVRDVQCNELEQAWDIKEYDSLLYLSDCAIDKKVILIMDKNGHIKSRIGLPGREVGLNVWPLGIAVDKENNDLYVCSCYSQTVFKCPNGKGRFKKFIRKGLANPRYLWVGPSHEVIVSNAGNHSVCKFNSWGHLIWKYGEKGSDNGQLDTPGGVCTDRWGNVYIADTNNDRIIHLTSKGKLVTNINIGHTIFKPQAVVFDATSLIVTTGLLEPELNQNRIYIIDCTYQRVQIHDILKK